MMASSAEGGSDPACRATPLLLFTVVSNHGATDDAVAEEETTVTVG